MPRNPASLSDDALMHELDVLTARERERTAAVIADLGEIDARRLYEPAGYPSMHSYAVHVLGLDGDSADLYIPAARIARKFPVIFAALADGRLHLETVLMLSARMTADNVDELVASASHKTEKEIAKLLAERFPGEDGPQDSE
jgi:hypothetical protein